MAELGAFFGNPNLQRQGARARALAAQRDVNTLADPRTYAIVQGLLGTAPDEMGFSVLNPNYEKIRKVAEPAFALGLLGQASPLLAPMTKGLPVGASVKNVGNDLLSYRGSHTAPDRDFGAPLHDLTGGGQMYPADVYSSKAAQIYGGGVPYDQKAFSIAQQYKDKPDALVTIYRAVPKDLSNSEKLATLEKQMAAYMKRGTLPKDADNYSSGSKWYDAAYEKREQLRKMPDEPTNDINAINAGDWVTLTREYAKDHGESTLKGEYKILSKKVKAKEVFTNADSIHEFGYQPQMAKPSQMVAPQQEALDTAQRNAALPIEEGGLGLPKDNTPEMRAEAMGFIDAYHGTTQGARKEQLRNAELWATDNPKVANTYATGRPEFGRPEGQTVMPLSVRLENPMVIDAPYGASWRQIDTALPNDPEVLPYSTDMLSDIAKKQGYDSLVVKNVFDVGGGRIPRSQKGQDALTGTTYAVFDPAQVRSRFAAFDPMRKNEKDILAGVLPLGLLTDEEQRKKLYELMPSLLGE